MPTTYNWSVKKILSSCVLNPEWQRNEGLWSKPMVTQLYEDVVNGSPVTPLLVYKEKKKKPVMLDGLQRISNLKNLINDPEVHKDIKKLVKDYEFAVVEFTDKEIAKESITDFYHKTNTSTVKLSAQEDRRANHIDYPYIKFVKKFRYSKPFTDFLSLFEINESEIYRMRLRFSDEEFVLKLVAYHLLREESPFLFHNSSKLIDKLVVPLTKKEIEGYTATIFEVIDTLYKKKGFPAIHFSTKYKGVMPLILGVISQYNLGGKKGIKKNAAKIREFLEDYWVLTGQEIAHKNQYPFSSGRNYYKEIARQITEFMDGL